jgi:hypothetical protein
MDEKNTKRVPLAVSQASRLIKENPLNRQQLATAAGVSTKTLQRIVQNDVPELSKSSNQKEIRAWIRAWVRLAKYFRKDAETWIKSMDIPWDVQMERLAMSSRPTSVGSRLPPFDVVLDSIRRSANSEKEQAVRVRLVAYPPFHEEGTNSFYARFTDELVGSINPLWRVEFQTFFRIEETINALLSNTDECHLVVGLFDTRPRRLRGVDFVNIPGWRVPLGGIYWKKPKGPSPTWHEVKDAAYAEKNFRVMVVEGEAGHHFLRGDCRYPDAIIEPVPRLDIRQIAGEFWQLAELFRTSSRTQIFVADENLCRAIWTEMKRSKPGASLGVVRACPDASGQPPTYKIGLAVRADARTWLQMLEIARDETMFGTRLANTAALYAEVILKGLTLLRLEDDSSKGSLRPSWHPVNFLLPSDEANEVFRTEMAKHLKKTFGKDLSTDILRSKIGRLLPKQWYDSIVAAISPVTTTAQSEAIGRIARALEDLTWALKQLQADIKSEAEES